MIAGQIANHLTEDALCEIFADAVRDNRDFMTWLLEQTKFAPHAQSARLLHEEQMSIRPRKRWWRHWWCHVKELEKDRETDIFMVFEANADQQPFRFSVHVENKRGIGKFENGQAFAYAVRANQMLNLAAYLSHHEYTTILVAPKQFADKYPADRDLFDVFISYQNLALHLPSYAQKN